MGAGAVGRVLPLLPSPMSPSPSASLLVKKDGSQDGRCCSVCVLMGSSSHCLELPLLALCRSWDVGTALPAPWAQAGVSVPWAAPLSCSCNYMLWLTTELWAVNVTVGAMQAVAMLQLWMFLGSIWAPLMRKCFCAFASGELGRCSWDTALLRLLPASCVVLPLRSCE